MKRVAVCVMLSAFFVSLSTPLSLPVSAAELPAEESGVSEIPVYTVPEAGVAYEIAEGQFIADLDAGAVSHGSVSMDQDEQYPGFLADYFPVGYVQMYTDSPTVIKTRFLVSDMEGEPLNGPDGAAWISDGGMFCRVGSTSDAWVKWTASAQDGAFVVTQLSYDTYMIGIGDEALASKYYGHTILLRCRAEYRDSNGLIRGVNEIIYLRVDANGLADGNQGTGASGLANAVAAGVDPDIESFGLEAEVGTGGSYTYKLDFAFKGRAVIQDVILYDEIEGRTAGSDTGSVTGISLDGFEDQVEVWIAPEGSGFDGAFAAQALDSQAQPEAFSQIDGLGGKTFYKLRSASALEDWCDANGAGSWPEIDTVAFVFDGPMEDNTEISGAFGLQMRLGPDVRVASEDGLTLSNDAGMAFLAQANTQGGQAMDVVTNMKSDVTAVHVYAGEDGTIGFELPATGGSGTFVYYIAGSMLICAGAALLTGRGRRKD